ncbi:MAG TPA: nitroreductase/quinone reductase family protein [Acidimicrobiia bacterium]|jgi:deazaflavin-dependent oxidoreductase (nitroreductase family)
MDQSLESALQRGGIVDITTTGRKSGTARRIEIYFHNLDGRYYITGRPGFSRDWIANLVADPAMTVHFKRGLTHDLAAIADVITDRDEKRRVIGRVRVESWGVDPAEVEADIEHWVETSPLIEFRPAG